MIFSSVDKRSTAIILWCYLVYGVVRCVGAPQGSTDIFIYIRDMLMPIKTYIYSHHHARQHATRLKIHLKKNQPLTSQEMLTVWSEWTNCTTLYLQDENNKQWIMLVESGTTNGQWTDVSFHKEKGDLCIALKGLPLQTTPNRLLITWLFIENVPRDNM